MTDPIISPDGKSMWFHGEWVMLSSNDITSTDEVILPLAPDLPEVKLDDVAHTYNLESVNLDSLEETESESKLEGIFASLCLLISGFMFLFSDYRELKDMNDDPSFIQEFILWFGSLFGLQIIGIILISLGIWILISSVNRSNHAISVTRDFTLKRLDTSSNIASHTDAFDFRLNYPKEMNQSRKFMYGLFLFSYTMIWFLALSVVADDWKNSTLDIFILIFIFLLCTIFSTVLAYYFGLGYVEVVYLKNKIIFMMFIISHTMWFLSSMLVLRLMSISSLTFTEDFKFLSHIEENIGFSLDIVYFFIVYFTCLLCYFSVSFPFNKYLKAKYESDWQSLVRK
jgi:hypothetical protein